MKNLIIYITILLSFYSNLWSNAQRSVNYVVEEVYYVVDVHLGYIDNLIFVSYEETFPAGWDLVPNYTAPYGLTNYTINGNKLIWNISSNFETPIVLSYAIKNPANPINTTVAFLGTTTGWNKYNFAKVENYTFGDSELFELRVTIQGLGTASQSTIWYKPNTSITLSASPFENSVFNKWIYISDSYTSDLFTNDISIDVDGPIELIADLAVFGS